MVFFAAIPPLAYFAVALTAILAVPPLCRRVRLPAVVGLLAAGVVLGPAELDVIPKSSVGAFLAALGKLLLMFFAGLEIDLGELRRAKGRTLGFGLLSFALPLTLGVLFGRACGYPWVTAVQIGGLFASHTLLGYPVVRRLGLLGDEAVVVSVGATVVTDLLALLVLAVCVPIHRTGFNPAGLALQLAELAVYVPLVLVGFGVGGRWLLRGASEEVQFGLMLIVTIVAAVGADLIHIDGIIGAFLAGLAVNEAVRGSPAKEKLEFLGNTLFIPAFFVGLGYALDIRSFLATPVEFPWVVLGVVGCPVAGKWLAARVVRWRFGYTRDQGLMVWSLSLPQVAATLAAAMAAYAATNAAGERLLPAEVLNAVYVLMVVTATLGPVLTEVAGARLVRSPEPR